MTDDAEEFTLRREARSEAADRIWNLADAAHNLHDLPGAEGLYHKVLEMLEQEFSPAMVLTIHDEGQA